MLGDGVLYMLVADVVLILWEDRLSLVAMVLDVRARITVVLPVDVPNHRLLHRDSLRSRPRCWLKLLVSLMGSNLMKASRYHLFTLD